MRTWLFKVCRLKILILICVHLVVLDVAAAQGGDVCPAGSYFDDVTKQCTLCPDRTYGPVTGLKACEWCPANAASTGRKGATKLEDCECQPGYYLHRGWRHCILCPTPQTQYYCPGVNGCSTDPKLQEEGWFLSKDMQSGSSASTWTTSLLYERCPSPKGCKPQKCDYRFSSKDTNEQCRFGHSGHLCFECLPGWFRRITLRYSVCRQCQGPWIGLIVVAVSLIIIGYIVTILARRTQRMLFHHIADIPTASWTFPKLSFTLLHIQLGLCVGGAALNIFSTTFQKSETTYAMDGYLVHYIAFIFAISLNVGFPADLAELPCLRPRTGTPILLFSAQLQVLFYNFIILLVLCVVGWTVFHVWRTRRLPQAIEGKFVSLTIGMWTAISGLHCCGFCLWMGSYLYMLLISQLTRYAAIALSCISRARGTQSYTVMAPSVVCGDHEYSELSRLGIVILILLTFGVPIGLVLGRRYIKDQKVKILYNTLSGGYNADMFWRAVIRFLLTHIIVIISVLMTDASILEKLVILTILVLGVYGWTYVVSGGLSSYTAYDKDTSYFSFWRSVRRYTGLHDFVSFERTALMAVAVSYLLLVLAGLYNKKAKGFSLALIIFSAVTQWGVSCLLVCDLFIEEVLPAAANCFPFHLLGFLRDKGPTGVYHAIQLLKNRTVNTVEAILIPPLRQAVLLSPVPAEALAELYIISRLPNLPSLPPEHMVNLVVEHGHIEPQTASLLNAQVLCQALEENASSAFLGPEDFRKRVAGALDTVAEQLHLQFKVQECQRRAEIIKSRYPFIRRVVRAAKPQKPVDWKEVLAVKEDIGVRTRWLAVTKLNVQLEELNRIKADFRYLFPSAAPVTS